jgi:hypothetical protein
LELQHKKLDEEFNALERRYLMDYHPEYLQPEEKISSSNPITVPDGINDDYEIPNGLLGVKKDIFNKLATHRLVDDHHLRERYEISQGTVPWTNHFTFTMKRAQKPNPKPHN